MRQASRPGRIASVLLGSLGATVFVVVVILTRDSDSSDRSPRCASDRVAPARFASYEWREAGWRTPTAREELIDAAERSCLDRVYVDLTGAASPEAERLGPLADDVMELARHARSRGIEVGAVAGDPWWPSPQGHIDAGRVLRFVDDINRDDTVLSSVHIDAEPWGLDEWPTMRVELTTAYLEFVASLEQARGRLGLRVPVVYLIPYWFDGSNGEAPLISFGGRTTDPFDHLTTIIEDGAAVAVMAYRNRALGEGGIVDLVRQELRQDRVPVLIGVETVAITPASATFAGFSLTRLHDELRLVVQHTGVEEIVINDVAGLQGLATPNSPPAS